MSSTARDNIFSKSARLNRSCSPTESHIYVWSARISVDCSVSSCSSSCFDHPQLNNTGECDDLPPPPPILPNLSEDASNTSGLSLPSPPLCVTELSALPSYVIPEITHPPSCVTLESAPIPSIVPPTSDQQVILIEKDPGPIEQSVTPKNVHEVSASSLHDHRRENNKKLTKKSKSKQRQKSSANTSISIDQNSDSSRIISSMFDAMKRKLSPDKEADTSRDSQKVKLCASNNS